MQWTYLFVIIATLFFPVVLSFESKVHYISSWKNSFLAAVIIAIPFILWDVLFTKLGYWGFNDEHLIGIKIFNLPLEEILFFIIIPFACTFIYEVVKYYFRNYNLATLSKVFYFIIPFYAVLLTIFGESGWYTLSVILSSTIALILLMKHQEYDKIILAFLICFLPFFIMNGILTGAITNEPIVWYSEEQKIAGRIFTIPFEDVLYNFSLLIPNMLLFEWLQKKSKG